MLDLKGLLKIQLEYKIVFNFWFARQLVIFFGMAIRSVAIESFKRELEYLIFMLV